MDSYNLNLISAMTNHLNQHKLESSLKETMSIMGGYSPQQRNSIARYYDTEVLEKFTDILGRPLRRDEMRYIAGNSSKVANAIMMGKNYFKIPRPFVLIPNIGHIPVIGPESPSYPSGHAAGYSALHKMFSKIDPQNEPRYRELRNNGAASRVLAGVHTPTDIIGGFIISDLII